MKTEGLMQRVGGQDWKIPVSRDYKLTISCQNFECPINKQKHCSMPSAIEISSGGFCETGRGLIAEKNKIDKMKKDNNKGIYKHEGD